MAFKPANAKTVKRLEQRLAVLRCQLDPWQAEQALRAAKALEDRRMAREAAKGTGGVKRCCQSCGRFKPRPSSRCDYCGDEPVSHNGSDIDFDRAYGAV